MSLIICLISSGQPSANPRLVKEAISLSRAGYNVIVIYVPISPWADEYDRLLFKKYSQIKWICAGFHAKDNHIGYLYVRLRKKIYEYIFRYTGNILNAAIKSLVLYSQELISTALKVKADLYIAHNIGALPALVKVSMRYHSKSIFDIEDFHRGESDEGSDSCKRVKLIEDKYIPLVDSLTAASIEIKTEYQNLFKSKSIKLINNSFPKSYGVTEVKNIPELPLKIFWFSQYVGKKRGIETVLSAMTKLPVGSISLTLMGSAGSEIKNYFQQIISKSKLEQTQLVFIDPVQENEIKTIASEHHIGLCSEYAHIENRDLCLTNKIFMYLLSGNALLISDTKAQKHFFQDNPNIGLLYKQEDANSLLEGLQFYLKNPTILNLHRNNALQLAKYKYNWDIEQLVFLDNVRKTLAS